MRKVNLIIFLVSLLTMRLTAADAADDVAGNALTAEQKTALAAVDVRLAAVETLAGKIDDRDYKAEVGRQIEDLKKSRLALEKNFDQGRYEALMHSVISRYQVIALWLKEPALPPPEKKPPESNTLTPDDIKIRPQ